MRHCGGPPPALSAAGRGASSHSEHGLPGLPFPASPAQVFGILTAQLVLTFAIVAFFSFSAAAQAFVFRNPGLCGSWPGSIHCA